LLAGARTETDEAFVRMPPQQMQAATAAGRDARALQSSIQIGTRQSVAAAQRIDHYLRAARDEATLDSVFLLESPCTASQRARSAQAQHPARIFGSDEVQRAAQRPGTNDRTFGDWLVRCEASVAARVRRPMAHSDPR
jgi:hypothetical protein